ncbi:SelB C-terminal domain-containing protein, partial [Halieaceae bacterium]|nr:SelB C-terminal domain-containing protein [Halieaceae bacterium]
SLVAAELIDKQLITLSANHYSRADHQVELDLATKRIWNLIEPPIREGGIRPPIIHELVELCKLELEPLKKALKNLCSKKYLVQVADNRYYLPETVIELAKMVEQTAQQNEPGAITVNEFRNHTGIGRNLSIQVLEYFDQLKYTRRDGNQRYLLKKPEQLFS